MGGTALWASRADDLSTNQSGRDDNGRGKRKSCGRPHSSAKVVILDLAADAWKGKEVGGANRFRSGLPYLRLGWDFYRSGRGLWLNRLQDFGRLCLRRRLSLWLRRARGRNVERV